MSQLELFVGCVFAIAYVVRILLFDDSAGPFESTKKLVVDNGAHEGLVDLFDRVRMVFGAYRAEDAGDGIKYWHTTVRMDMWRCPKCLSFWVSSLASAPFTIFVGEPLAFPLVHLAMAFCAQFLVFVQLWFEGKEE